MSMDFLRSFLSVSTIHGLSHFVAKKRHPIELFIWFSLMVTAIYGVITLSSMTLTRYINNPTVISMERDRFSWNTSYPSATICPHFKINETLLDDYVANSKETNKTKLREFLVSLLEVNYNNLDQVKIYDGLAPEEYVKVSLDLQFVFRPAVANSGIGVSAKVLEKIVTEMGICYTFNSKLAVYSTAEYWAKMSWKLEEPSDSLYVNPLDGDIFTNMVNMSTGFDVLFIIFLVLKTIAEITKEKQFLLSIKKRYSFFLTDK